MLLSIRPRSSILAIAHASGGFGALSRHGVKPAAGAGCGCVEGKKTAAILHKLEMHAAAGMHAAKADKWTPRDWYLHAKEEDDKLFPLLRKIALELPAKERDEVVAEVDALEADHVRVVYPAYRAGRMPPAPEMAVHGAREDVLVQKYGDRLLRAFRLNAPSTARAFVGTWWSDLLPSETGPAEKFADPRLACRGGKPVGGLEYLQDVPNSAKARVAAMRQKIEDLGAAESKGVAPIARASFEAVRKSAIELRNGYESLLRKSTDPREQQKFADRLGVSLPEAVKQAPAFLKAWVDVDIKKIGQDIWKAVGPQIMQEFKKIAESVGAMSSSVAGATKGLGSGFGEAAPIFLAMITFAIDSTLSYDHATDELFQKLCSDYINNMIVSPLQKTNATGFPYPWHALEFNLGCMGAVGISEGEFRADKWDATPSQGKAADAVGSNRNRWESVSDIELLANAIHWWTLAVQLMSLPEVKKVFTALGNDEDGGMWASDEQVMLVAAPIAAANNIPVDAFAEELWKRSAGWRDAPSSSLVPEPGVAPFEYVCVAHCSKFDLYSSVWEPRSTGAPAPCATEAANAMQVQFGVLARDAFNLLEDVKTGKIDLRTSPTFLLSAPNESGAVNGATGEAKATKWAPLMLGTIGSGALLFFGVSKLVSAAPAGIGAAMTFLGGGKSETKMVTPPPPAPSGGFTYVAPPKPEAPLPDYSGYTRIDRPSPFG